MAIKTSRLGALALSLVACFTSTFGLTFMSSFAFAQPETGQYTIDAAHSGVTFAADHMGYTQVQGRFNEFSGSFTVDVKGKVNLQVDIVAASIDTNLSKRDDHLRSPDFFNVKQFPEIRFSSSVVLEAELSENKIQTIEGELSLLGVTRPITLTLTKGKEAQDPWGYHRIGYRATSVVKRSDFGMEFMLGGLGDEITVVITIEAIKAK
ncbi:MAG: polyisoprenoid-binding protein YceI [Flavobacteriales bacterium]|jgi:polyisoprenoid-binding protein YceI